MEFLIELTRNYPVPGWLAVSALVINFVWFFSKILIWIVRFVDKANKNCEVSKEIQEDSKEIHKDINAIHKTHIILIEKFNNLVNALCEKKAIGNRKLFSVNSPLGLTEDGKIFVSRLGWDNVISNDKYRETLFSALDKIGLSTKYDVEKYCTVILSEYSGSAKESPYTPIKKYLYEHADIDDTEALMACSIFLRDKYLEAHPEIKD